MPAKFSNQSPFTDRYYTMEFDLYEQDEFESRYLAWQGGKCLLQDAFPELSDDAREFIKSGITPEEWTKYMGGDDDT